MAGSHNSETPWVDREDLEEDVSRCFKYSGRPFGGPVYRNIRSEPREQFLVACVFSIEFRMVLAVGYNQKSGLLASIAQEKLYNYDEENVSHISVNDAWLSQVVVVMMMVTVTI